MQVNIDFCQFEHHSQIGESITITMSSNTILFM